MQLLFLRLFFILFQINELLLAHSDRLFNKTGELIFSTAIFLFQVRPKHDEILFDHLLHELVGGGTYSAKPILGLVDRCQHTIDNFQLRYFRFTLLLRLLF